MSGGENATCGECVEGMGLGTCQQCHTKYFCPDRKVRLLFLFHEGEAKHLLLNLGILMP